MLQAMNIIKRNLRCYALWLTALLLLAGGRAAAQTRYYVSAEATDDGTSWQSTTTLTEALRNARAGDEIWMQGGTYTAPAEGFTLPSGVSLYGGFQGTETRTDERETLGKPFQFAHPTVISGDINKNDERDPDLLIFPENPTRADNATHVLTLNLDPAGNTGNQPTVVNGITVTRGHADGTGADGMGADGMGGGIYVTGGGGTFRLERCFLLYNYATRGGAVYVANDVKGSENRISQCVVFNNAAGERSGQQNAGGGLYIAGTATVVNSAIYNNENGGLRISADAAVVNCTVARNTGAGIDLTAGSDVQNVVNTVIWGNTTLSLEHQPAYRYCVYHETNGVEVDNVGNRYVNDKNNAADGPHFESPSLRTGFDREFSHAEQHYPLWSWSVLEGSVMIDQGSAELYDDALGAQDIAGNDRQSGSQIDIGAFEYAQLPASRIRYVSAGATGDGTSWNNASGDLQRMIDELAAAGTPGEVWVAAGTYVPQSQVISGTAYSASFLMRDGISVYGGFAGTETSKLARPKEDGGKPWQYTNRTILQGTYYDPAQLTWNTDRWTLTADSRHVVWFAPLPAEQKSGFSHITTLSGVTLRGGYAQGGAGQTEFLTDRGAGVYMAANAYLRECVVMENVATGPGGGVYLQQGGRVMNCLVYNNEAAQGGGVYMENAGLVLASMVSNNSAADGGGVYMAHTGAWTDGLPHPEYLILSSSVVSHNTSRTNGAVYCDGGGIVQQTTLTKNYCPTATDNVNPDASQTGGLYLDGYGLVLNSVIWDNPINGVDVPMYARNHTAGTVRFMYTAVSSQNNAVWNNTYQQEVISLADANHGAEGEMGPDFTDGFEDEPGVQAGWTYQNGTDGITYFWEPLTGSNLRARGMTLGALPDEVIMAPELDMNQELFAQKPALGAYAIQATPLRYDATTDPKALIVYVDAECTTPAHDGSSWPQAYRSLNEALVYLAGLPQNEVNGRRLEVHVLEGDLWPRYAYTNLDPLTATVQIPATASGQTLYLYGGYHREADDSVTRDPLRYRSHINGNHEGQSLDGGLYHCITVAEGAQVVIDGFHITGGYAAGTASQQSGAGLLAVAGANVTLRRCIFENHTARTAAAVDASAAAALTLENCVINNNTNTDSTQPVISGPADATTLRHVTVVNNLGAAPANLGASSFAAGNTGGNSNNLANLKTLGGDGGEKHFANPTNQRGATLGYDTYLGGYAEFRPLTSSAEAANLINHATADNMTPDTDIAGQPRDLGGTPDLGAYEAILPEAGTVIYVTPDGAGNKDGSSWENAIAGNMIYQISGGSDGFSGENLNVPTTSTEYIGFREDGHQYGETSGASKLFFDHGYDEEQCNVEVRTTGGWRPQTTYSINIRNNRQEEYVGGLQYAVEKAAAAAAIDGQQRTVWVAAGTYTDYKGFVIRDKVNVLGGFPNSGAPGETDRHPLLSQYVTPNSDMSDLKAEDYETILQVQDVSPVVMVNGVPQKNSAANLPDHTRKPVLFQPDVCLPTLSPSGREALYYNNGRYRNIAEDLHTNSDTPSNTNRYNRTNNTNGTYVEYSGALWDGFTIRHGFLTDYSANRDGGAGVRMFRGVTLQNCVVAENYVNDYRSDYNNSEGSGTACMGGGIYCDGENSSVISCYVVHNVNNNPNSSGGGMTLLVGTSYNCVVANNYSFKDGGGCFIENAHFYNNTVAYNTVTNGNGGGIYQWYREKDGEGKPITMNLVLYNTIIYGNNKTAIGGNAKAFSGAHYCYIQTAQNMDSGFTGRFYNSEWGANLSDPFIDADNANYRLNTELEGGNICLNNGTDALGSGITLPDTDMDFTERVKDCAVDIGAFESENEQNYAYDTAADDSLVYYVTQSGAGLRSGGSADNAACAMKLQRILADAGQTAKENPDAAVVVRIAGYKPDDNGNRFTYRANTLSNPNDPQSYTYVVPEGITVEGGWDEDFNNRNPKERPTVLSAEYEGSATQQAVTGYHAVLFRAAAAGSATDGTAALTRPTVIDGLTLTGGSATSMAGAGDSRTRGGGAIVPAGAQVRNCIVENCTAEQGGGLYVMAGATVSGTVVYHNTAEQGAGIYADNEDADSTCRAHLISCTVTDNTATTAGGGLYLEDGALMALNSVVWGNQAPSDKNVSGVVTQTFKDKFWQTVFDASGLTAFYPFNYCYVETYEMPSNFENTAMTGEENVYFASTDRTLKAYSPLVKHGVSTDCLTALQEHANVAPADLAGTSRTTGTRLDVGAYAFKGGVMPTDRLVTRLFVAQGTPQQLDDDADESEYLGRSFFTPLSWLDDALDYIRAVRDNDVANADTHFEILIAGGTYVPSQRRPDATTPGHDQRQNSYVIPPNVSLYGGFSGEETYSSSVTRDNVQHDLESIPLKRGDQDVTCNGNITEILNARQASDFNQNGIMEPWELAQQTILSGHLNASAKERNAYHVIYTSGPSNHPVVLDGLTVMDGETYHVLSEVTDRDERGRGGGVYANGVPYVINRCRFVGNRAVRGGAIYVRNARLSLANTILAGNGTVDDPQYASTQPPRGGAVYVASVDEDSQAALYAANTLWVNNESTGAGGAFATNIVDGISTVYAPQVHLLNNTFAHNKDAFNGVYFIRDGKSEAVNTLMWGNEGTNIDLLKPISFRHSASDAATLNGTDNLPQLSADNMATNGPRFARPSAAAGMAANDATSQWNPAAVSVLTDAGSGMVPEGGGTEQGEYMTWWTENELADYKPDNDNYMSAGYRRYSGPLKEDGTEGNHPIDIGVYEYQYELAFSKMDTIYVATEESGEGNGTSWANATSDLRGALVAMANPRGGGEVTGHATPYKAVMIKAGTYAWPYLSTGTAFPITLSASDDHGVSLGIHGSFNASGVQDFSQPTVITTHDTQLSATQTLMNIAAGHKPVTVEGLTFINSNPDDEATGLRIGADDSRGSVTLRQTGFRLSSVGLDINSGNRGTMLLVNTLFADGGTGLQGADGRTTVVNATFAQNSVDYTTADGPGPAIYNTVAWKNEKQNLTTSEANRNVPIADGVANTDVMNGPNFRDPDNTTDVAARDYRIRPSLRLLNQGSNAAYAQHGLGLTADAAIPDDEVDLASGVRVVDDRIDVGAYEYEAPLQPIVYVKELTGGTADGRSWATALRDLQGAADLAGLYAHNHASDSAFVFVHSNYNRPAEALQLSLPRVKVYGGMNNETSSHTLPDDYTADNVRQITADLIGQRRGVLESASRSTLGSLTLSAGAAGTVADGFEVRGSATLGAGLLATSVVRGAVSGEADGVLYNSLVLPAADDAQAGGSVTGVTAVNVTATGAISGATGSGNNRPAIGDTLNRYVTDDLWNRQLMETSADIDPTTDRTDITEYITQVGHARDLIGNRRERNDTVDNGCFETWNIPAGTVAEVTATDYPIGKSVVYVRRGAELQLPGLLADGTDLYPDAANAFSPGYLLLEHQAGLRGRGSYVALTNFGVERDVPAATADDAPGADLAAMPFRVRAVEGAGTDNGVSLKRYDGATRAAYDYAYDGTDSKAWKPVDLTTEGQSSVGFLIENSSDAARTVRFAGQSYTEGGTTPKSVTLQLYNHNADWSSPDEPGDRFTHKENMSWNLFGSPYLCAMNYDDMAYGRVLYGLEDDATYRTVNTADETTGDEATGHIPAGDAVFTQTATLSTDGERVDVSPSDAVKGTAYATRAALTLTLRAAGTDTLTAPDVLQLNTAPADEARTDFSLDADGVKWMAAGAVPQLYAVRGAGRYALLSGVNEAGTTALGVRAAGHTTYELSAAGAEAYSAVVLTDHLTGRSVDLKAGAYTFSLPADTCVDNRFSLRFSLSDEGGLTTGGVSIEQLADGRIRVSGLERTDRVRAFNVAGQLEMERAATAAQMEFRLERGTHVVEVGRGGRSRAAVKLRVR